MRQRHPSRAQQGWSRQIEHDLTTEFDDYEWTVEFPVYIDATYQNGRYGEQSVARHGYAANAPFIRTLQQARYHYGKRFGIESSYQLSEKTLISTTSQDPVQQLLLVVILVMQNAWRYIHWEYVATLRRGGRRLWDWSFEELIRMITRAGGTALAVRRAVSANRPPDDRFKR